MITALGYLGVRTDRLADWSDYARGQLGMQAVDRGAGQTAFRMDDRKQRLIVTAEPGDDLEPSSRWSTRATATTATCPPGPA